MDEYHYQRLLKEDTTFGLPSDLHFVEILRYEVLGTVLEIDIPALTISQDVSKNTFSDRDVPENDVPDWLQRTVI
jgi:hypothetical protein